MNRRLIVISFACIALLAGRQYVTVPAGSFKIGALPDEQGTSDAPVRGDHAQALHRGQDHAPAGRAGLGLPPGNDVRAPPGWWRATR